jgi:hypothetical protein
MMDEMGVKDYRLLDTPDAARQYFASDLDFWQHQQDIGGSGIDAMKAYTGSGYGQMNSFMREVTDDASHYAKESITELAGVLENFELQEDTIFFRGVDDLNYTLKEYGLDNLSNRLTDIMFNVTKGMIEDNNPNEDVDYYINGPWDTHFYINGEQM